MNARAESIVVLGLGSANGDDQFGWEVIEQLQRTGTNIQLRKIRHPLDILPWLDRANHLHIVDAAIGLPEETFVWTLRANDPSHMRLISDIPANGTHDFGLYQTLQIAETLGKPIGQITFWLGRAEHFYPMRSMSESAKHSVLECLDLLANKIHHR